MVICFEKTPRCQIRPLAGQHIDSTITFAAQDSSMINESAIANWDIVGFVEKVLDLLKRAEESYKERTNS